MSDTRNAYFIYLVRPVFEVSFRDFTDCWCVVHRPAVTSLPPRNIMKIIAALLLLTIAAHSAMAQTLTPVVLHNFSRNEGYSLAPLTLGTDGNFYSTTQSGGSADLGTAFRMTPDGTFTTLVSFTGPNGLSPSIVGLVPDGKGNFYGTTVYGGSSNRGTLFKVTSNGNLTTLVSFDN